MPSNGFSNGFDHAWENRLGLPLLADLRALPMSTVTAITGHAAAGCAQGCPLPAAAAPRRAAAVVGIVRAMLVVELVGPQRAVSQAGPRREREALGEDRRG